MGHSPAMVSPLTQPKLLSAPVPACSAQGSLAGAHTCTCVRVCLHARMLHACLPACRSAFEAVVNNTFDISSFNRSLLKKGAMSKKALRGYQERYLVRPHVHVCMQGQGRTPTLWATDSCRVRYTPCPASMQAQGCITASAHEPNHLHM